MLATPSEAKCNKHDLPSNIAIHNLTSNKGSQTP